jgi:hypothetical protein
MPIQSPQTNCISMGHHRLTPRNKSNSSRSHFPRSKFMTTIPGRLSSSSFYPTLPQVTLIPPNGNSTHHPKISRPRTAEKNQTATTSTTPHLSSKINPSPSSRPTATSTVLQPTLLVPFDRIQSFLQYLPRFLD